jgi:hypothetical protein
MPKRRPTRGHITSPGARISFLPRRQAEPRLSSQRLPAPRARPARSSSSTVSQIIVDCHWRLRRIQELEFALYAHGHEQFESVFQDCPQSERASRILLQTHLTYEKQFRNLHTQEARIDRKRAKALAELQRLQAEREPRNEPSHEDLSDREAFALFDAGYVPSEIAAAIAATAPTPQNGFVFSSDQKADENGIGC